MKKMIVLASAVFAFSAQAKSPKIPLQKCGLPSSTAELEEVGAEELFYVDASKKALTDVEIAMVSELVYGEDEDGDIIGGFASADGGITYFKLNHKLYAQVSYYPGDNEAGGIYKVKSIRGKYQSYSLVATIGDGEINCN